MPAADTATPAVISPCDRVCVVDPRAKACIGCGRSLDEIARWIMFSDGERAAIMAQLPARLAAMKAAAMKAGATKAGGSASA